MKDKIVLLIYGITMGVANIIPGVSGGTVAVTLGIYDQLVEAVGTFLTDRERRWEHVRFLSLLACGAVIGVFLLAWIIEYALTNYHAWTLLFFMGLILGSMPSVVRMHRTRKGDIQFVHALALTLGLGGVLLLGGEPSGIAAATPPGGHHCYVMVAVASFCAGGAMILPGISGSLILLLFGQYEHIVQAIMAVDLATLATVALGAILGMLILARILSQALRRYRDPMHFFIIGLVGGSFVVLYPGMPNGFDGRLGGLGILVLGSVLAFRLTPIRTQA